MYPSFPEEDFQQYDFSEGEDEEKKVAEGESREVKKDSDERCEATSLPFQYDFSKVKKKNTEQLNTRDKLK